MLPSSSNVYQSPYGASGIQNVLAERHSKTPIVKRPKKHISSGLVTVGLMAGSAVAAYKYKGNIQNAFQNIKKIAGSNKAKFSGKFPNLSQSMSYLKKACNAPIKAVRSFFKI